MNSISIGDSLSGKFFLDIDEGDGFVGHGVVIGPTQGGKYLVNFWHDDVQNKYAETISPELMANWRYYEQKALWKEDREELYRVMNVVDE